MAEYAYIHIPFCRKKCLYCAFTSVSRNNLIPAYLVALKTQIQTSYKNEPLKTLYFGGGTPSLLNANEIGDILSLYNFSDDAEITIEVNPESACEDFLNNVYEKGVNRISVGVQSFSDDILRSIGRIHNSQQAKTVIEQAQKAGFDNISADFIYGLPAQSLESFLSDLKAALELGVSHISLYGLKIEEGTPFYEKIPENIADSDLHADMYLSAIKFLTERGFEHYEISNFSLDKKYSRHNTNYWNTGEYYGFGASAHGYIDGVRYVNNCSVEEYIKSPCTQEASHKLSEQEKMEEAVFLGLRRGGGINFSDFKTRFGIDFRMKFASQLCKYNDFLVITDSGCSFTKEGFLVSNTILADFLED